MRAAMRTKMKTYGNYENDCPDGPRTTTSCGPVNARRPADFPPPLAGGGKLLARSGSNLGEGALVHVRRPSPNPHMLSDVRLATSQGEEGRIFLRAFEWELWFLPREA